MANLLQGYSGYLRALLFSCFSGLKLLSSAGNVGSLISNRARVLLRTDGSSSPTEDSILLGFTFLLLYSWKPETTTWVQVVELGDESRKHEWGNDNVRQRREKTQQGCVNKWLPPWALKKSCVPTERLGHWSFNFCLSSDEGNCHSFGYNWVQQG